MHNHVLTTLDHTPCMPCHAMPCHACSSQPCAPSTTGRNGSWNPLHLVRYTTPLSLPLSSTVVSCKTYFPASPTVSRWPPSERSSTITSACTCNRRWSRSKRSSRSSSKCKRCRKSAKWMRACACINLGDEGKHTYMYTCKSWLICGILQALANEELRLETLYKGMEEEVCVCTYVCTCLYVRMYVCVCVCVCVCDVLFATLQLTILACSFGRNKSEQLHWEQGPRTRFFFCDSALCVWRVGLSCLTLLLPYLTGQSQLQDGKGARSQDRWAG